MGEAPCELCVNPGSLPEGDRARELQLGRYDGSEMIQIVSRLNIESKFVSSTDIESRRLALREECL